MYCQRCGAEIRPDERFCRNCGAPAAARQAAALSAVMRGVQETATAAAAAIPTEPLSETPSLTQDFAVTRERFNLILGGTLLWGFLMNILFCIFLGEAAARLPYGVVMIAYVILAFSGILINTRSQKPIWSFVGYNLVVLPLGLVLSLLIADAGADAVRETFQITAVVTAGMLLLSNRKPELFSRMGPCLFGALLLALAAELVSFLFHRSFEWMNVIVALIFCGYIGFDWARAQQRPSTADNAIDSACALYLDIINLALRILSSRSRRRD
jgi:FtsH-binding integral membrane protein